MRPSEQVETVGCLVGWLLCWLSYFSHTTCSFSYVITIVAVAVAAAFVVVVVVVVDDDDDDGGGGGGDGDDAIDDFYGMIKVFEIM